MAFIPGINPDFRAIAERLAPGRAVRSITIRVEADAAATALVEVLLEHDDMLLVAKIGGEIEPDNVTIVEAKDA